MAPNFDTNHSVDVMRCQTPTVVCGHAVEINTPEILVGILGLAYQMTTL